VETVDGQLTETELMDEDGGGGAATETTVEPEMLVCWLLAAVTVTLPGAAGAVNSPEDEIVPALADQLTAEL
jgi:hypothetical protein